MKDEMTAKEAVKQIKENCYFASISEKTKQALDMASKALEQRPSEDCISRQKALDCFEQTNTRQGAKHAIETLPSVTPQTPEGRWIEERDDYGEIIHWHCSNCYEDSGFITNCKWNYCPYCGAKMKAESEEK